MESQEMSVELNSVVSCPSCGVATAVQMPTDACQFFWVCPGCGERLRPEVGDCCVFCSYGTVLCPPKQQERGAAANEA
ncbi:GDCCVxC domain-containing (seleno)protein [Glutamicibacter mysorens]|uniref:GDCCVxC domain-containing (seleno)protein n=1 Tax=Glutamicibacter mysorens TaxID=257984 RepID=UPI003F5CB9D9